MKNTIEKPQMKTTPKGCSYWAGTGAYSEEYKKLNKKLVPSSGDAPTVHGELIRAIGRLSYDFYNNGNCNVQDYDSWDCDDYGNPTSDTEIFIKPYYKRMINFIYAHADAGREVQRLENFLTDYLHYGDYEKFDKYTPIYNALFDKVIYGVLTAGLDGDKPNPEFGREDV